MPAIDSVVVERLVRGIRVAANDDERRAATRIMHSRGYPDSTIAVRIGANVRKVREYLNEKAASAS